MVTHPALEVDVDPNVWLLGPTDDRPFERWLPEAVDVTCRVFGVSSDERAADLVTLVLARIGRDAAYAGLPYRVIRWPEPTTVPLVASVGIVTRPEAGSADDFLRDFDMEVVEAPVVQTRVHDDGVISRAVAYGQLGGALLVEVRYVVDHGHPDVVVLVQAVERRPGAITPVLGDLDALAGALRVLSDAP